MMYHDDKETMNDDLRTFLKRYALVNLNTARDVLYVHSKLGLSEKSFFLEGGLIIPFLHFSTQKTCYLP